MVGKALVTNGDRICAWFILLLALVPPAIVLIGILNASPLPDLDYWYALERLTGPNGLSLGLNLLTLHSNEHLIPFAGLVYAVNAALFYGSSVTLSLFAFGMGAIQVILLGSLLPSVLTERRVERAVWFLVISLAVFTPAAHHNWLRGMSGVCWISANTFSILAVFLLTRVVAHFSWPLLIGGIVAGYCAALSYSTGLMVWPLLALVGAYAWRTDKRVLATLTGAVIPLIALVVLTAERPAHHGEGPRLAFEMASHGKFFLSLLGGVFDSAPVGAGLLLLGGFGFLLAVRSGGRDQRIAWPFLLLMLYPILNAIVSAVFRAEIRIDAAASSRYASLPSLFALFVAVALLSTLRGRILGLGRIVIPSMVIVAGVTAYFTNEGEIKRQVAYQDRKNVAALSLKLSLPDRELLTQTTMRDFERFIAMQPRLIAMGHVPFEGGGVSCPAIGDTLSSRDSERSLELKLLERKRLRLIDGREVVRVSGIVTPKVKEAECVVFVNEANAVVGRAVPTFFHFPRGDQNFSDRSIRWSGYLESPGESQGVRVALVHSAGVIARSGPFFAAHN